MMLGGAKAGYTIVETMIFLAVTGVLFASALATVNGRQASVQFTQSVQDYQSKLEEIINQVSSGYYLNNGDFTCDVVVSSASSRPTFSATPSAQGSSNKCVLMGKAIHFTSSGASESSAGAIKYNLISIAGRRLNSKTPPQEVQTFAEALPTAIAPTSTTGTVTQTFAGISNKIESGETQYGLRVTRIVNPLDTTTTYDMIVLLTSLPKLAGQSSNLASGKQRVNFAALRTSTVLTSNTLNAATTINAINDSINLNPLNGIVICLAGSGDKRAMITVGEGAGRASARLDVGGYNKTLCEG